MYDIYLFTLLYINLDFIVFHIIAAQLSDKSYWEIKTKNLLQQII